MSTKKNVSIVNGIDNEVKRNLVGVNLESCDIGYKNMVLIYFCLENEAFSGMNHMVECMRRIKNNSKYKIPEIKDIKLRIKYNEFDYFSKCKIIVIT